MRYILGEVFSDYLWDVIRFQELGSIIIIPTLLKNQLLKPQAFLLLSRCVDLPLAEQQQSTTTNMFQIFDLYEYLVCWTLL